MEKTFNEIANEEFLKLILKLHKMGTNISNSDMERFRAVYRSGFDAGAAAVQDRWIDSLSKVISKKNDA